MEYHPSKGLIQHFRHALNDQNSLSFNDVRDLVEMPDGNLWIATWGGGLNYLDTKKGIFYAYKKKMDTENSLNSNNVVDLQDTKEGLWIATFGGGLVYMDFLTKQFTTYSLNKNTSTVNSQEDNNLLCLHLDKEGYLWIGTWKNGLYQLNTQTHEIHWLKEETIKNQTVTAILEDDIGDLWLSTKEGILWYKKVKATFHSFPDYVGEYHINSKYKDKNGAIYFGGKSGVIILEPEQLKQHTPIEPDIVLTDIQIFDQSSQTSSEGILQKNISTTNSIDLTYSQNTITIHFTAMDFPNAQNWEYAIQLIGLDKHWRELGNQHNTTFTNLSPGDYEFRVKSKHKGGIWNENFTAMKIVVEKPFWATNWAYLVYILLIGLALYLFRKYTIAWEKMKHKLQMEALLHQKDKELHEAKQRFFNTISHEIRTPITLMFAAMSQLKKQAFQTLGN